MDIQINTDHNIRGGEDLDLHLKGVLEGVLRHDAGGVRDAIDGAADS